MRDGVQKIKNPPAFPDTASLVGSWWRGVPIVCHRCRGTFALTVEADEYAGCASEDMKPGGWRYTIPFHAGPPMPTIETICPYCRVWVQVGLTYVRPGEQRLFTIGMDDRITE